MEQAQSCSAIQSAAGTADQGKLLPRALLFLTASIYFRVQFSADALLLAGNELQCVSLVGNSSPPQHTMLRILDVLIDLGVLGIRCCAPRSLL
jgi:hypothetical protein